MEFGIHDNKQRDKVSMGRCDGVRNEDIWSDNNDDEGRCTILEGRIRIIPYSRPPLLLQPQLRRCDTEPSSLCHSLSTRTVLRLNLKVPTFLRPQLYIQLLHVSRP